MRTVAASLISALAGALLATACGPDGEAAASASSALEGPSRGLVIVSPPSPIVSPEGESIRSDRPFFHDFGHVAFGEVVEHVFRLVNTDPEPVTVHDLLPSCGCTTPRMTARTPDGGVIHGKLKGDPVIVLPPGAEASLTVRIDTASMRSFNVDKLETVRLRCDSEHTPFMSFETHVLVRRLFQAEPGALDFGKVPASVGATLSTKVTSVARQTPAAIVDVDSVEGPLVARVSEGLVLNVPLWTLQVEVLAGEPLGALTGTVHLATLGEDGEPGEPFAIAVHGEIVPDVVVEPAALHLTRAGRVEARLRSLVPGGRVLVEGGRLEGPERDRLRFEAQAVEPDAAGRSTEWRLFLNADPTLAGTAFAGTLVLELDDGTVPTIEVPYVSRP